MQMYVNRYDQEVKQADENPTIDSCCVSKTIILSSNIPQEKSTIRSLQNNIPSISLRHKILSNSFSICWELIQMISMKNNPNIYSCQILSFFSSYETSLSITVSWRMRQIYPEARAHLSEVQRRVDRTWCGGGDGQVFVTVWWLEKICKLQLYDIQL